jgi:hypothetical protein
MVRILIFLISIFFSGIASGQDRWIVDSLHQVLQDKTAADRYLVLRRLAVEYVDVDDKLALQIATQAEQAARVSNDSVSIVKILRLKVQILFRLDQIEEMLAACAEALPLAARTHSFDEYILIANIFGNGYLYQSRFDKALQFYFLAHETARKERSANLIGMVLGNIGITYYKLKDYRKALVYFLESYTIKKATGTLGFDTPLNLSLCHFQLNEHKRASEFLRESVIICGAGCPTQSMTHIKYASGCIAFGMKQFDKAQAEFISSYNFAKSNGDSRMQLDNICLLVDILIKENQIKDAMHYLNEGEKLVDQGVSFHLEMIKLYARFSQVYISVRDFENASIYQSKYIALKDSIYNEGLTTSLMKIESHFLERENEQKLAEQAEIMILKEQIIGRQYLLNVVTGLLAMTCILFVAFLFKNYRRNKELNHLLDNKIRERTLELEANKNELANSLRLRDLLVQNAFLDISHVSTTIGGLCYTGIRDVSDPAAQIYFGQIDKLNAQLAEYLRSRYPTQLIIPASGDSGYEKIFLGAGPKSNL